MLGHFGRIWFITKRKSEEKKRFGSQCTSAKLSSKIEEPSSKPSTWFCDPLMIHNRTQKSINLWPEIPGLTDHTTTSEKKCCPNFCRVKSPEKPSLSMDPDYPLPNFKRLNLAGLGASEPGYPECHHHPWEACVVFPFLSGKKWVVLDIWAESLHILFLLGGMGSLDWAQHLTCTIWATFKTLMTIHYTGCLIGILIVV